MSATTDEPILRDDVKPASFQGKERYWEAAEEWLEMTLTPEQREICEAVAENRYLLVEGANGFGKTFGNVALSHAFHKRHYPSSVVVTSGTYGKLKRTFCADAENLNDALPGPLQGDWKWSPNPHIDMGGEPTWQFEVHSPEDPEELEGVHNDHTLVIVDEADKKEVDATVIDSMESLVSDDNDRMVVISNPPKDEQNVVYQLRDDAKYGHVHFSSFDSHNVQLEAGWRDGDESDMVGGLATVTKLKDDWRSYNNEPWPGLEQAREWSDPESEEFRDDLGVRWYRRRAGIMPPTAASKHRPFFKDDVQAAFEGEGRTQPTGRPIAAAADVARKGGDETVVCVLYENTAELTAWSHTDHPENETKIRKIFAGLSGTWDSAIDAIGEGSGVADTMQEEFGTHRFKASESACENDDWDTKWTEALAHLGEWLPDLDLTGVDPGREPYLRKDLFAAARVVEYENRSLKSGDVLKATPKSEIKEHIDRSPDRLDALAMACWAAEAEPEDDKASGTATWGF